MYDAVSVVVKAVKQLQRTGAPRLRVANLSCDELRAWPHGSSLYNYINLASPHCVTGAIRGWIQTRREPRAAFGIAEARSSYIRIP